MFLPPVTPEADLLPSQLPQATYFFGKDARASCRMITISLLLIGF